MVDRHTIFNDERIIILPAIKTLGSNNITNYYSKINYLQTFCVQKYLHAYVKLLAILKFWVIYASHNPI